MRPKVFISHWMPEIGVNIIKEHCDVDYYDGTIPLEKKELIERAKDKDALVCFVPDIIDREVLEECSNLKVISSFGKGYDNIDIEACTDHNVLVLINKQALTESTADLAIGLLLSMSRKILLGDHHVRSGEFNGWHAKKYLGKDFHHSKLGIIGLGEIGQAIVKRAMGFDAEISYYDRHRVKDFEKEYTIHYESNLYELLRKNDFIIVAVNLNPGTYHLIGKDELDVINPNSILINISRGSAVDEEAIAESLQNGKLFGYASDVFEFEDSMNENKKNYINESLLLSKGKTVFTPHIGTGTIEAREQLAISTANQLVLALHGEKPNGAINDERIEMFQTTN
ncbi:NAD(P)-dependent oxidoreductase [Oceanobacillus damuensis]|uniref:NAD(P)-dependent oxidoreductase n=1 Tax=Oceanobacillus damuensis TaxID=937928 RepID=UPI000835EAB6|nr:NAD(P)-dependent oxidoreductase [Oceanobacillus damuensis]